MTTVMVREPLPGDPRCERVRKVVERPILFSGPMVRALLDGSKTQTRRVVNPQPEQRGSCGPVLSGVPAWYWQSPRYDNGDGVHYLHTDEESARRLMVRACPLGQPGDRLWVRETLRESDGSVWLYDADGAPIEMCEDDRRVPAMLSWAHHKDRDVCVSIHMPRWASRITLEITDVSVERVQDISADDALAEGVRSLDENFPLIAARVPLEIHAYAYLWDKLNKKRGFGWDVNPWVWVLTFRKVTT